MKTKKALLSSVEIREISELMGEAVHNQWMELRKAEKGWHAPENCPAKESYAKLQSLPEKQRPPKVPALGKYCDNCHPCMRPYKDLPESEKVLDRQYPALFLKVLKSKGYMIARSK